MSVVEQLAGVIERELEPQALVSDPVAVGGVAPALVIEPADAAQLATAVRLVAEAGLVVLPAGGRSRLARGHAPGRAFVLLSTRRVAGVIEHAAADMTVTARAGTPRALLDRVLESEDQWLPVETPFPERSTLGGMIATAPSGPLRLGHGTLRDYLLGVTVVNAAGRAVRSGGRVVKNVAGYDLCKLYLGSWGSLGVIVEATFKVKPRPERFVWLVARAPDADTAFGLASSLASAGVRPVGFEVLLGTAPRHAGLEAETAVAIALEGIETEVAWQRSRLEIVCAAAGIEGLALHDGARARAWGQSLVTMGFESETHRGLLVWGAVLPSRLPALARVWLEHPVDAACLLSAGTGVARAWLPAGTPGDLERMRIAAETLGGHAHAAVGAPAPGGGRSGTPPPAPARRLAARLKKALDPTGALLQAPVMTDD